MDLLFTAALVFALLVAGRVAVGWSRRRRRLSAARVPEGERLRGVDSAPARVFVSRDVMDGPKAGVINNAPVALSLCADRLIVATHHGRLLELTADGGSARCTGPRRLVIEGERLRKDGPLQIRVEVILEDAEGWAGQIEGALRPGGE